MSSYLLCEVLLTHYNVHLLSVSAYIKSFDTVNVQLLFVLGYTKSIDTVKCTVTICLRLHKVYRHSIVYSNFPFGYINSIDTV